jgi:putative 4-mercaptohistidine N1-methyltranferase
MPSPPDIYETGRLLDEYLLFHYGSAEELLPALDAAPSLRQAMAGAVDFPVRTVSHFTTRHAGRALDLGCAVGRSSFELSATCDEVIGIDYSHGFIRAANALREGRHLAYQRHEEAHLHTTLTSSMPPHARPERVRFEQGDAMNLRTDLGVFDRVHAANLICRLSEPLRLLERLPALVSPGGELLLATPCTWLAEFTPPDHWPPGETFAWLQQKLGPSFELVHSAHELFLIRETARKFQWSLSQVSLWRRLPK